VDPAIEHAETERVLRAAREICVAILDGRVTPHDGSRAITASCRDTDIHPPLALHTFVYADSEWDERPDDSDIFADGIVAAARELALRDEP
jgi:hypothetical protein